MGRLEGLGPGLVWVLACLLVVAIMHKKHGVAASAERISFKDAMIILWRAIPSLLLIVIVPALSMWLPTTIGLV